MAEEKRMDSDGNYYTREEFLACYGNLDRWDASETRVDPTTGSRKTRKEFIEQYGGLAQWEEAGRVKAASAAAETRVDPADGQRYTHADFVACYGAQAEAKWARAAHEHRVDPADGKAYTQQDFVVCYGGTAQWDAARPVSIPAAQWTGPAAPAASTAAVAPPAAVPVKHADPTPAPPAPAEVEAKPVTAPPTGQGRHELPKRKEARTISLSASVASVSPPLTRENSPSNKVLKVISPTAQGTAGGEASTSPTPAKQLISPGGALVSPKQNIVERKPLVGITQTPDLPTPVAEDVVDDDGRTGVSIIVVGHVDAGKSTMMGHLLFDLDIVPQRVLHKYEKESKAIGKPSFHYAWVLDETEEERERGVTMDIATAYFTTKTKRVMLLDAPGHSAFVSRTALGASQADAAVVVVNAIPGEFETGVERGQTREHILILRGSGIRHLIIAVNKIDAVKYRAERFYEVKTRLSELLNQVGFKPDHVTWVPVSGLNGDNLIKPSENLAWWDEASEGKPVALVDAIDNLPSMKRVVNHPLRLSISDVLKNMVGGRIDSGRVAEGQKIYVQPGLYPATVKSIERNQKAVKTAFAGDNVELTLTGIDPQYLMVGGVLCEAAFPAKMCTRVEAQILCVHDSVTIMKSYKCVAHVQSSSIDATVTRILPGPDGKATKMLFEKKVGLLQLTFSQAIPVELVKEFKGLGRIILRSNGVTVGMGTVTKVYPDAA